MIEERGNAVAGKITDIGEYQITNLGLSGLGTLVCHLAAAYFVEEDAMTGADFTEANYDGYTPLPLTYLGMEPLDPGGKQTGDFDTLVFMCIGASVPNMIWGYWVEDVAGNVLLVERLSGGPRPMTDNGMHVDLQISIRGWSPV